MMANKDVITMPNRPKIGLALSGGGAKGIAHLGVLKALEERHIPIDMISGVSAGSIVAALYADGHSYDELLDFFQRCNLFQMVSLNLPKYGGFATMKGFRDSLKELLQAKKFEDLEIDTESYKRDGAAPLVNNKVEALEFVAKANSKVLNIKLKDLKVKDKILICGIIRNNEVIIPSGDDMILENDSVIVVTTNQFLDELTDILR